MYFCCYALYVLLVLKYIPYEKLLKEKGETTETNLGLYLHDLCSPVLESWWIQTAMVNLSLTQRTKWWLVLICRIWKIVTQYIIIIVKVLYKIFLYFMFSLFLRLLERKVLDPNGPYIITSQTKIRHICLSTDMNSARECVFLSKVKTKIIINDSNTFLTMSTQFMDKYVLIIPF